MKIFTIKNLDEIPTPEPAPEPAPEETPDPAVFDTPKTTKAKTKKSKHKISPLKLRDDFVNKIVNDKKNINN